MSRRFVASVLSIGLGLGAAFGIAGSASAAESPGSGFVFAHGTFDEYHPGRTASTYDPALVPVGSKAKVFGVAPPSGGTKVGLAVRGLVPEREYGAHVHTNSCGETGDAAGPHFQNVPDPVQPSTDPAYANPENEVWLDFTTDKHGTGFAKSRVDWQVGDRSAKSVVIHEEHTHTAPGEAGQAGARLACINVDF
ncbi:MAG: superoxide dismutase [Pseudonocardiaceae bacterium]|nr:superoxide dismutase [Pseudonocardiaceae bacterium]